MSNPAGFLLSYVNSAIVQTDWTLTVDTSFASGSLTAGTLLSGTLDVLRDPRNSTRCTLQGTRATAGSVRIQLQFSAPDVDVGPQIKAALVGLMNNTITAPGATSISVGAIVSGLEGTSTPSISLWTPPSADFPQHMWAFSPDPERTDITRVRIWVEATFGSGGGTLTLTTGGLWVGPALVPADGIDAAWRMEVVDSGTMARSAGGQGFARTRQRYRQLSGSIRNIGVEWAYGVSGGTNVDLQQLLYRVGTTTPVVVFARTRNAAGDLDVHTQHRLGIYGHFTDVGSIAHEGGNVFSWTGFRVAELL